MPAVLSRESFNTDLVGRISLFPAAATYVVVVEMDQFPA